MSWSSVICSYTSGACRGSRSRARGVHVRVTGVHRSATSDVSWPLLPPSYERQLGHARRIELASDRRIRERNKIKYRLSHLPIWIFVFFIAPGPLTFDL